METNKFASTLRRPIESFSFIYFKFPARTPPCLIVFHLIHPFRSFSMVIHRRHCFIFVQAAIKLLASTIRPAHATVASKRRVNCLHWRKFWVMSGILSLCGEPRLDPTVSGWSTLVCTLSALLILSFVPNCWYSIKVINTLCLLTFLLVRVDYCTLLFLLCHELLMFDERLFGSFI